MSFSNEISDKLLDIKPIPIFLPATHDTASAEAGVPAVSEKKWAYITMGTWCAVGTETKEPLINNEVFKTGYANIGAVEGRNIVTKNITGLWIIQQCMERWRKDQARKIEWSEIDEMYPKAKQFNTFIDIDDPEFSFHSNNMPKLISSYCNKRNFNVPNSISGISRCFYESLVMKFRLNLNILEKVTSQKLYTIHLIGGGSKNKLLCQWVADLTGKEVFAGPTETTSAGNLIMLLKGTGEISSLKEGRQVILNSSIVSKYEPRGKMKDIWEEQYSRYLKLFNFDLLH